MLTKLKEFCETNNNNIYLYGAGKYGRKIGVWLDEKNCNWIGYLETEPEHDEVLERRINRLSEIYDKKDIAVIVCVGEKNRNDIVSNLKANGITNYYTVSRTEVDAAEKDNQYKNCYKTDKNIMVLLYHRVIDLSSDPQLLAINIKNFEAHIRYLKENYRILRFEEDWKDIKEKSVVITFDDGYADNYYNALPVLEEYKVPATFFVSTGNIDSDNEMWWDELEALFLLNRNLPDSVMLLDTRLDLSTEEEIYKSYILAHRILKALDFEERDKELRCLINELNPSDYPRKNYRMMTSEELRKMSRSKYVTIGGHTVTHSSLANEDNDTQEWEIVQSKKRIEEIIGSKIDVFSYPFGSSDDYTDDTCSIVKKAGYEKAAIVRDGLFLDEDPMKISRNLIRNWNVEEFISRINRLWCLCG